MKEVTKLPSNNPFIKFFFTIDPSIVHNSTCLSIHYKVLQTSACRVVAVEGFRSVAILQVGALLDEVCSSTHINYLTLFVLYIAYGF